MSKIKETIPDSGEWREEPKEPVDTCEFYPLYSRVHVWGYGQNDPENVLHGLICSPLLPYYYGESTSMGYLVKLDEPLYVSRTDGAATGKMQIVFVHYSSCEYIAAGSPPNSNEESSDE